MKILVGKIIKPQGVKGELKVQCMLDDANMLSNVRHLYLSSVRYSVSHLRAQHDVFFVKLDGVNDRDSAENCRGWELYADKHTIDISTNSHFIQDLLQCTVYTEDGELLGKLVDIAQYGSADVYTVQCAYGSISFPWLKCLINSVDIDSNKIVLYKAELDKVAVHND